MLRLEKGVIVVIVNVDKMYLVLKLICRQISFIIMFIKTFFLFGFLRFEFLRQFILNNLDIF